MKPNILMILSVLWNLMLATIPVVLSYLIRSAASSNASKASRYVTIALLAPIWLVFLPNTCYLLTEWRHFLYVLDSRNLYMYTRVDPSYYIPLVKGSLFFACYSAYGMVTFALAIRPIKRMARRAGAALWFWTAPFYIMISLGVYLGLVLRFNSWDFLSNPGAIWAAAADALTRPTLSLFILCFAAFLWMAFEALDIWIDGASLRLKNLRTRSELAAEKE